MTAQKGSYYKYQTTNPLYQMLVDHFKNNVNELLNMIEFRSVLEVGCGEGEIINNINCSYPQLENVKAFDISDDIISIAQSSFPGIEFMVASVYDQVFPDSFFDLVVCCEVLEHLVEPEEGLLNIIRMSSKYVLISVPNEPLWRICNVLRGAYLSDWGNTPGHVNHWTPQKFHAFLKPYARIIAQRKPFPWTMVLLERY